MRKIVSFMMLLLLSSSMAIAQTRTITGKVSEANGEPIPFASITLKGSKITAIGEADGSFKIQAKSGDVLTVSAVNFDPMDVTVGSESSLTVSLTRNSTALTDVVVTTALGVRRQKKELGYATARVTSDEITNANPVNIANGLQGKVSGLNVTTLNNGVFADVKINLRGIRSLTGNNNPMLLLDGVPVPISYLSTLNPNDIDDINVLKGASGAAVYGPDARNGVIVVTTKKTSKGGAPVISLSNSTQFESISFFPKMQYQFGSGGYGAYTPYENWSWGDAFDGSVREIGHQLEDGTQDSALYSPLRDEKKNFFNTGVTIQNDISYASKDFYMSIQDANIRGIVPHDKNRRTGLRLSSTKEYGRFRAQFNVNYIQQNYNIFDDDQMQDYYTANNVGLNGGLMNLIFNLPSQIPITKYEDFKNNKFATYNNYFNDYGINPYIAIDNWRQQGKSDNLIANIDLSMKATDWLSFTYRAAVNTTTIVTTRTSKGQIANSYGQDRGFTTIPDAVSEGSDRSSRLSSEIFASINKSFGNLRMNVILGNYMRQADVKQSLVGASDLVVPELFNVGNLLGSLNGSSFSSRTRLVSFYGLVGLSYKGWANIEITGRNDQTSVLALDNNSFFYPGVSASLVLSDVIPAIKNSNTISYLKLRGGYNKTANADIAPYLLASTYSSVTNGFPYGQIPGYSANASSYDPNLKPEGIASTEIGIELGFMKNRINIEAAYFNQNCTDQIISVGVSNATGYSSAFRNAASFVNKGVELDLRLTPLFKFRNGSVDIKANATYNTNEVQELYPGLDRLTIGGFSGLAENFAIAGNPAYVFGLTDWSRDDQGRVIVNQATGRPIADPTIKFFGRSMPLWIVGITPSVSYHGLSLTVVGEYRGGHYAFHSIGDAMAWTGVSEATAINDRQPFVIPNSVYLDADGKSVPNTNIPINNVNDFFTNEYRDVATNFFTSAASWRIREVSLAYDFPVKVFGKQNVIKGLSLAVTARNLALFLPKSNVYSDPDFSFATTGNINGIGTSQINPPTRIIGGTINVRF